MISLSKTFEKTKCLKNKSLRKLLSSSGFSFPKQKQKSKNKDVIDFHSESYFSHSCKSSNKDIFLIPSKTERNNTENVNHPKQKEAFHKFKSLSFKFSNANAPSPYQKFNFKIPSQEDDKNMINFNNFNNFNNNNNQKIFSTSYIEDEKENKINDNSLQELKHNLFDNRQEESNKAQKNCEYSKFNKIYERFRNRLDNITKVFYNMGKNLSNNPTPEKNNERTERKINEDYTFNKVPTVSNFEAAKDETTALNLSQKDENKNENLDFTLKNINSFNQLDESNRLNSNFNISPFIAEEQNNQINSKNKKEENNLKRNKLFSVQSIQHINLNTSFNISVKEKAYKITNFEINIPNANQKNYNCNKLNDGKTSSVSRENNFSSPRRFNSNLLGIVESSVFIRSQDTKDKHHYKPAGETISNCSKNSINSNNKPSYNKKKTQNPFNIFIKEFKLDKEDNENNLKTKMSSNSNSNLKKKSNKNANVQNKEMAASYKTMKLEGKEIEEYKRTSNKFKTKNNIYEKYIKYSNCFMNDVMSRHNNPYNKCSDESNNNSRIEYAANPNQIVSKSNEGLNKDNKNICIEKEKDKETRLKVNLLSKLKTLNYNEHRRKESINKHVEDLINKTENTLHEEKLSIPYPEAKENKNIYSDTNKQANDQPCIPNDGINIFSKYLAMSISKSPFSTIFTRDIGSEFNKYINIGKSTQDK